MGEENAPQIEEEPGALRVSFDIDALTLTDWALLDEMRLGEEGWKRPGIVRDVIDMLKRCCGGEVGDLHISDLPSLIEQLGQAIRDSGALAPESVEMRA